MDLADPVTTRLGLNHNRAVTRRAALIALDQMDGSDLKPPEVTPYRAEEDKRLRAAEVADSLRTFVSVAGELGPQLAALLFQLPPNFKKDLPLLSEFLSLLPRKNT